MAYKTCKKCSLPQYKMDLCPKHYQESINEGWEKTDKGAAAKPVRRKAPKKRFVRKRSHKRLSTKEHAARFLVKNNICGPKDDIWPLGLIIMASLELGANERDIGEATGVDGKTIALAAQRLTDNGLWKNGKVGLEKNISGYKKDPISFVIEVSLHILIAAGQVYVKR